MAGVQIRSASERDSDKISGLIISLSILPWVREVPSEDIIANIRDKFKAMGSSTRIFVAETNSGNIVGYGSITLIPNLLLEGKEGYVSELFVADNSRGIGIGTDILRRMEEYARENGCSRLSLLNLEDRESYRRSYYPKRGWQERAGAKNMVKNLEMK